MRTPQKASVAQPPPSHRSVDERSEWHHGKRSAAAYFPVVMLSVAKPYERSER